MIHPVKKYLLFSALVAGLLVGIIIFGWIFIVWSVGTITGALLGWSLMVRYWPQPIGRLITAVLKLQTRLRDPGPRAADACSEDWPQWFAAQARTGWQRGHASISSRWGKCVDLDNVLPEYPRPQLYSRRGGAKGRREAEYSLAVC